ncbi:MAG: hypothetical protein IRY91_08455 [Gemmatimonadaceae bacterium]|nr:hypothetical protein [Gemmatimonadaceae bacterium]
MTVRRLLCLAAVLAAAACGSGDDGLAYRAYTDHYVFRITADPTPPHARERTRYKVVVRDKDTGQPIEGGEGRIFASSRDGASTWDSFVAGPEVGTYYANLNYVVSGDWAVAIQFRRDSTHTLERADWMQEVAPERSSTP